MNPFSLAALINAITSLSLGILVYFKAREKESNRLFFLLMAAIGLWSLGVCQMMKAGSEAEAMLWTRILHLGSIVIPFLFLRFVFSVLKMDKERQRIPLRLGWGMTGLFLILNFTPWFISRVEPTLVFPYYPHAGPAYPFFAFYLLLVVCYGLSLLINGYQNASGLTRNQLKYLFWSWALGFGGGAYTFLPAFNVDILPWGLFLIPVALVTESYAIVKFHSMDINIVFRRGMVYSILVVLLTAFFLIVLLGLERFLRTYIGYSSMVATAVAALVLAVGFQPLKEKVQSLVDRVFFRGVYDYHQTLRRTSEAMTSILRLDHLIDRLLSSIVHDMKVEGASLFLMNPQRTGLKLSAGRFYRSCFPSPTCSFIPEEWAVVRRVEWEHLPLVREGIHDRIRSEEGEEISREMQRLGAELAIPVILQDQLSALLLLGPKLSGDPFSEDDLQLLMTLANQAAVAIKNAQLYDEVTSVKEHQENILRNLESGVVAVDCEGRITTFNQAAERITGMPAAEALGRDCRILDEKLADLLLSTLSQRRGRSGLEFDLRIKGGEVISIGITTSLLQGPEGSLLGAIALFSDLTEIKKLQIEKWRAEKLAYIGTLAASIAHEIKNPLVSIKTLAQLLPDRHDDEEFRNHFSQIALKEVDRIDLLVSQMLDLKGEAQPARFEILQLEEIVEEILLLLSEQIRRQKIRIERRYRASSYSTEGDRFQLKQALWNVILNSVQAMEEGGVLTISTDHRVNGEDSGEKLILTISDTGPGIPAENLAKVFDPFFTTKQGGSGLGLSICYKIVSDHHGTIQVDSREKEGTSLHIILPAIKASIP